MRELIVSLGEILAKDVVCKQLSDIGVLEYEVLSVGASEDEKGPMVLLELRSLRHPGIGTRPLYHNDSAETRIILVRRLRPEGKTEKDMQDAVMHCVRSVDRVPFQTHGVEPISQTLDREIKVLRKVVEAYELGKSSEMKQSVKSYDDVYGSNGHNRCLGADD